MAGRINAQYPRAIGGMIEVIRFGGMLMYVRDIILARENNPKRGRTAKGLGLQAWLAEHAPEVNYKTACRLLYVTEKVAERFQLPSRVSFIDISATPVEELPAKLQKKQMELWDFVSGTSQRSWLDQFTPRGGSRERPNGTKRRTKPEKEFDDKLKQAMDWYEFGFTSLKLSYQEPAITWLNLPDVELANVADVVKRLSKELDEVCRKRKIVPVKLANWHCEEEEAK